MKIANRFLALVALATLLPLGSIVAQSDGSVEIKGKSELSIDRIFASSDFTEESPGRMFYEGSFEFDGYLRVENSPDGIGEELVYYPRSSEEKERVVISAKELIPEGREKQIIIEDVSYNENNAYFLIRTASKRVWRQNTKADYWIFWRDSRKLVKLGGDIPPSSMMFAKFDYVGGWVVYVYENNIYAQDVFNLTITPVTTDGSRTVINGTSDWVYEEELDLRDAFRVRDDLSSSREEIAFWQFNTESVPEYSLNNVSESLYPEVRKFPYPKVGQQNAAVRIGVATLELGRSEVPIRWISIPGDSRNSYIARMEWVPEAEHQLVVQQFNRLQNENRVYLVDTTSMKVDLVYCEKDPAWLENDNPFRWLRLTEHELLWLSERNGWRNAYRLPIVPDSHLEPLIVGEFDIIDIVKNDEFIDDLTVYFSASGGNPTEQMLYRYYEEKDEPGTVELISPGSQKGWHSYQFMGSNMVRHSYSAFGQPPVHEVLDLVDPSQSRTLSSNEKVRKNLESLAEVRHEFRRVNIGNGIELDAWVMYPPNFDPTRKYPLLMHVYGEPHGQTVRNAWGGNQYLWHRMLAEQGYIIASVDNRGTKSPRGREWRKVVHRQIGILASAEQAAATRQLLVDIPSIDAKKIAIWGWSGGGSMSLNAIFRYPDLYNTAMAIAPVPDQKLYDTIYQERYMGMPTDNEEGYRLGSPITFAHQLKGNLLIVHGTGDDNCHYQGVERLMNVLIANNKQFTVMPYPNRSHSINEGANTTRHLFSLLAKYLKEHMPPN